MCSGMAMDIFEAIHLFREARAEVERMASSRVDISGSEVSASFARRQASIVTGDESIRISMSSKN